MLNVVNANIFRLVTFKNWYVIAVNVKFFVIFVIGNFASIKP